MVAYENELSLVSLAGTLSVLSLNQSVNQQFTL